jgi:flagellar hook protein FlgE
MGLQSAMTTALTGLQAAETTIDVVGNNVANSNTAGFKESNVLFATQFLQTQSIGSGPSTSSGGTNPRQTGLGVSVAEIAPNFTQGTIQVSANPLDLAIQGDGFFILQGPNGGSQQFYTRNGQFKTNAINQLVSISGNRVLGYGVNDQFVIDTNTVKPLTIPFGGSAVAQETNNVSLVGNLLPNDSNISTHPGIIESVVLNDNTVEKPTTAPTIQQIPPPTPGTVAANAIGSGGGATGIEAGTYNYKAVFVDPNAPAGHNEGPPSIAFGPTTTDGTQSVDVSGLPASPDISIYTKMNIYREDGSGTYKFVSQINAVAAGTTGFTDDVRSTSLGANLDDDGLDLGGSYNYFVTFANANLESRPTPLSTTESVSLADHRIALDGLPDSSSGLFDTIKIYRNTKEQPGNYYLVDQVPMHTQDYIDNKSDAAIIDPSKLLNRNGPGVTTSLALKNVATFDGTNYVDLFPNNGTLEFTGSKGANGGLDLATKSLTITDTTTLQDLINFVQQSLGIQVTSPDPDNPLTGTPGGSITGDNRLHFESNEGQANAVNINQNAFRLIAADGTLTTIPLNFSASVPAANGEGSSSEMVVYDSLGIPLTVRLTTALESTSNGVTTYRWFATSSDNQPASGVSTTVGTGLITFGGTGKFISATDESVSIERRNVASNSPVTFDLDFSQITALSESSASQVQASSQDGFAAGTLSTFSITESGRIKGVYSNGVTRDLGQIIMARFNNPGGLLQIGDNLFAEGVNSGEPLRDIPGASGIGSLTAGAIELSNTDIGQNLIELILASTQYRGGTRVITSAQQLLDELLNLRR